MFYLLSALVLAFSWWLPWWWVLAPAFWVGTRSTSALKAFLVSFLAVEISTIPVAYYFDLRASGLISHRLAGLLNLPSPWLGYLLAGLISGLAAGCAALVGYHLISNSAEAFKNLETKSSGK